VKALEDGARHVCMRRESASLLLPVAGEATRIEAKTRIRDTGSKRTRMLLMPYMYVASLVERRRTFAATRQIEG